MRHTTIAVLLLTALCTMPLAEEVWGNTAWAQEERLVEVMGGFTWSDNDDVGRVYDLDFNLDFPLGDYLQLGPELGVSHVSLNNEPNIETLAIGGRLSWNFFRGPSGIGLAASALYNTGDIADSGTLTPELFGKFYTDSGGIRISIGRPYQFTDDTSDLFSLETTQVKAQFVWMF